MKFFFAVIAALSLSATPSRAVDEPTTIPDIILASRLDLAWSEMLIARLRRYVMNLNLGDPLGARVDKDIEIADISPRDVLAPSSRRMVSEVGAMVGLHLTEARSKIVVRNLEYKLDSVTTDLRPLVRNPDGQVFDGIFAARGASIGADAIELVLEIPTAGRRRLPLIKVTIRKPFIKTAETFPIVAQAQVQVVEEASALSFKVLNSSFESLANLMGKNPDAFELGFETIDIPDVSISIGNRRMNIEPDKVRQAIVSRQQIIKELLIEQLRGQLRQGIAQKALDLVQTVKIPKEYWVTVDKMQMQLKVARISGARGNQNVIVRVDSDFCTLVKWGESAENCVNTKVTTPAPSVTTPEKLRNSIDEMKATLGQGDVNMVASVSEDYINKLVSTTVDAGYFDQKMLESGATFGPKKTFVRLNERGDTGTLYVDINYRLSGVQSVLVGGNSIRFPLVLKCTMKIVKSPAGYPLVVFNVKEAVLDNRTLRRGFPELGLPSTVERLRRFESKVVKTIRDTVRPMIGQDIIQLELPVFQGVGLESLEFVSDGLGRASAHANLEDVIATRKSMTP